MPEKPVRRLRSGSCLTCLWNLRLRTRIEITRDFDRPPVQAPVSQIHCSKLGLGPVFGVRWTNRQLRRCRSFTEPLPCPSIESIQEDSFDGTLAAVRGVLPSMFHQTNLPECSRCSG